jgi:hypothetical protein
MKYKKEKLDAVYLLCSHCIFLTIRCAKILEGQFREKNIDASLDHKMQENFVQYFQGKSASYGLENMVGLQQWIYLEGLSKAKENFQSG